MSEIEASLSETMEELPKSSIQQLTIAVATGIFIYHNALRRELLRKGIDICEFTAEEP